MEFDALALARFQFAFTVTFHIVFPAFSIGLASYLAVLEGLVARHRAAGVPGAVRLLEADLRGRVRHGRRLRAGHELPVRHQLERVLRQDRPGARAADGLRGALGILPRGGLSRCDAVRHEPGRAEPALLRDADGGGRHAVLGILDPECQQLDADAGRIRDERGRTVRGQGLVGGDLQPVVSLPSRPHGAGSIPDDGVRGRGGGRVASAGRSAQRGRARDVLDGDVDGDHSGTDAGRSRRRAWPRHSRAPAGQDRGDGGTFRHPGGGAADPGRLARHGGRDDALRDRDPEARQPHSDP